jgi:archaellum component FlaG (FlaF/FlaG flagellin family)
MEVDFNTGRNPITGASQSIVRPPAAAPVTESTDTTMPFERTQSLEQSLKDTSQVRPEKVAQASALIADPNYPSDETLNRMAGLLAKHLNG